LKWPKSDFREVTKFNVFPVRVRSWASPETSEQ